MKFAYTPVVSVDYGNTYTFGATKTLNIFTDDIASDRQLPKLNKNGKFHVCSSVVIALLKFHG